MGNLWGKAQRFDMRQDSEEKFKFTIVVRMPFFVLRHLLGVMTVTQLPNITSMINAI